MPQIGVGIIGSGKIALANHLPGFALVPQAKVVALCDVSPASLEEASRETGITATYTDYREMLKRDDVHAAVIATPNFTHAQMVIDAANAGKHVLCEKPLALNLEDARRMLEAAERNEVVHMTAFTYRFVPAMQYAKHLVESGAVGRPFHFRAQRFQDWADKNLGWRQAKKLAGYGELGDMLSHRIDYAHFLVGPMKRLVADMRLLVLERGGKPSDLEDWVAILTEFENECSGVLESTKLATGRGENLKGRDAVEVNGSEGTIVYSTQRPLEIEIGRRGDSDLHVENVPRRFLTWPGSPRNPDEGDPVVTFRWDQNVEFVNAILEKRPARPSFVDGVRAQAAMDAAVQSYEQKRWVDVPRV